jgi:two-component system alkaline phosphatase synthesis response regulator PhoP
MSNFIPKSKRNRKKSDTPTKDIFHIGTLEINISLHSVSIDSKVISFAKKEFEALAYLAMHKGNIISRKALLNAVWGEGIIVLERTIDVHIRKIREKLGKYSYLIETVKGVGYCFRGNKRNK